MSSRKAFKSFKKKLKSKADEKNLSLLNRWAKATGVNYSEITESRRSGTYTASDARDPLTGKYEWGVSHAATIWFDKKTRKPRMASFMFGRPSFLDPYATSAFVGSEGRSILIDIQDPRKFIKSANRFFEGIPPLIGFCTDYTNDCNYDMARDIDSLPGVDARAKDSVLITGGVVPINIAV